MSAMLTITNATVAHAAEVARLLHAFNSEFDTFTPGVERLANRIGELITTGEIDVLLVGAPASGFGILSFRPSLYSSRPVAYLEELYVVPDLRGEGHGRALLDAALEVSRARGAERIELGTSADDIAAIGLYESSGFTNLEGAPDGPSMLFYEREL